MILKKLKTKFTGIELFPTIDSFINHILLIDKNIKNENDLIKPIFGRLYYEFLNDDISIYYSEINKWLQKHYKFKTRKFGNIEYFTIRGWSEDNAKLELEKRNLELKQRNRLCIEYWLKKGFSRDESILKIREQQIYSNSKVVNHKSRTIKDLEQLGWSDDEISDYMKSRSHFTTLYWIKRGYSEEESKNKISEIQTRNSQKLSLKKLLTPENYNSILQNQVGYWKKKGFSKDESIKLVSKRQKTFTLEKCIKKYGEEKGKEVFTERQIKWSNSLTNNGNMKNGYSKISQELFWILLENYNINDRKDIHFTTHNGEYKINNPDGGIFLYDFTDLKNKKIIEFHGDMFHGNPKKFKSADYPNPFSNKKTAQDMWNNDEKKLNLANQQGFNLLVVWDSEYRIKDKTKITQKCLDFLLKNIN